MPSFAPPSPSFVVLIAAFGGLLAGAAPAAGQTAAAGAAPPFAANGWQLHDYNMPKRRRPSAGPAATG